MRNSERPGFPTFVVLGKGIPAFEELEVALPRLTGQMLADVVHRKGVSAGGLDGWSWREFKGLPFFCGMMSLLVFFPRLRKLVFG